MSVGVVNKQTGDRIPTAGMPAIDSVLSGSSTNPVQNRVVKAALDEKADTDLVASDFDATASYTAENYCIYEGKFYRFKNNHSGAWAAADVDEIQIAGELSSIKSGLTNVGAYNAIPVKVGTWLGNDLYRVVKDIGTLPNSTIKTVDAGIGNRAQVVSMRGFAYGVDGHTIPIPFISANQTADRVEINYSREYSLLQIVTTMDLSTYSGYVVIDYYIIS